MVCHLHKIRAKVGNFRELVKICDKKSEKQLFLGYEKQTVRIVLKKFPILCNKYVVLHKKVCFLCNRMYKLNKKLYFCQRNKEKEHEDYPSESTKRA